MNLTLVGAVGESLQRSIVEIVHPTDVETLRGPAVRFVGAADSQTIRREVSQLCASARVDHAYLEPDVRLEGHRLLAMDMDSTLITIECIDEMADFAGKKAEVAAITEATMRGEIADFSESLKRRVALLAGMDASLLERVYSERLRLSVGASALIDAVRKAGVYCLLVSGGFTFFSERLRQALHFDEARANVLEIDDGRLTGQLVGTIVDANTKAAAVQSAIDKLGCARRDVIVIGDGANDIRMMLDGTLSVAYHAKPVLRRHARVAIDHGGLDVLLNYLAL